MKFAWLIVSMGATAGAAVVFWPNGSQDSEFVRSHEVGVLQERSEFAQVNALPQIGHDTSVNDGLQPTSETANRVNLDETHQMLRVLNGRN